MALILKSIREIVELANNLRYRPVQNQASAPSRIDLLVRWEERTKQIEAALQAARAQSSRAVEDKIAEIVRTTPPRELTLGDQLALLLALRSISCWSGMISFAQWVNDAQREFLSVIEVSQQYAMALNRLGGALNRAVAERKLLAIIDAQRGDSETYGILGRIYKDVWLERTPVNVDDEFFLRALNAYWEGLQRNPTEVYPPINILTLAKMANWPTALSGLANYTFRLLTERLQSGKPDYFDYATMVELHSAMGDLDKAWDAAREAAPAAKEPWELETTARTLSLLARFGRAPGLDELAAFLRDQAPKAVATKVVMSAA